MLIGLEENAYHLQQQGQITDDALPSLAAPLGYPAKTRKVGSAIETQVGRIPLNFPFVRRDTQAKTELANWRADGSSIAHVELRLSLRCIGCRRLFAAGAI